jgi:N-acetylglutamate synthase-like GNAT family acetyltransferase
LSIATRIATNDERPAVEAFYRAQLGRAVPLEGDQVVVIARDDDAIVAVLRLCPEAGTLLLRTVVVAKDRRGQGIGAALLQEASQAIGGRECWCFPWSYLERFYEQIGFTRVADDDVPSVLHHRWDREECIATYRAAGR